MKMLIHRLRRRQVHPFDRGELFDARALDRGDRAEMLVECFDPALAHAGDGQQFADSLRLLAQLAVERDRKSVRLVAYALQKFERIAVARQNDRLALPGQKHFLFALGEADERDVGDAERGHDLHDRRQLSLASVDDDEVGTRAEAVVLAALFELGQPPCQRLLQRGEIVVALDSLDAKFAICRLVGFTVGEHDHRRDFVRAADVRDVIALHARRHAFEMQIFRQLHHRADRHVVLPLLDRKRLFEIVARVGRRHVAQLPPHSLARGDDVDLFAEFFGQILLQDVRVLDVNGQHRLVGREHVAVIKAHHKIGQSDRVAQAVIVDDEFVAADHLACADKQQRDDGVEPVALDREHVEVEIFGKRADLPADELVEHLQFLPVIERKLILFTLRRLVHLVGQQLGDRLVVAGQKGYHLFDDCAVLLFGYLAGAGRVAALDVIVEARTVPRRDALHVQLAVAQTKRAVDEVGDLLRRDADHVRSEIF